MSLDGDNYLSEKESGIDIIYFVHFCYMMCYYYGLSVSYFEIVIKNQNVHEMYKVRKGCLKQHQRVQ